MRRLDKLEAIRKANLLAESRHLKSNSLVNESQSQFPVYHKSYGSAIDAVDDYIKSRGYELDQEEYRNAYIDAFFKPKTGKYKNDSLSIYKDGKKQKKMLQVQIYNMGSMGSEGANDTFELNMYVN